MSEQRERREAVLAQAQRRWHRRGGATARQTAARRAVAALRTATAARRTTG